MVVTACSPTIGPVVESVQVLVVLDSLDGKLRIIPVDSPSVVHTLTIATGTSHPGALALHGNLAAIGLGDSLMIVSLAPAHTLCTPTRFAPPRFTGPAAVVAVDFTDDGTKAYAAIPQSNLVPNLSPSCAGGTDSIPGGPRGFRNARGILFVVVSNRHSCPVVTTACPELPSWLETLAGDSIPLSGPGNATSAVLGADGMLYVAVAGNGAANGNLDQVDPVSLRETLAIPLFARSPKYVAAAGGDSIFIASPLDGLMVWDVRTRRLVRGPNTAPVGDARGLVVDDFGRVYVLQASTCAASAQGTIVVLGADLVTRPPITVGRCPVAIGVTDIPAAFYHFED